MTKWSQLQLETQSFSPAWGGYSRVSNRGKGISKKRAGVDEERESKREGSRVRARPRSREHSERVKNEKQETKRDGRLQTEEAGVKEKRGWLKKKALFKKKTLFRL